MLTLTLEYFLLAISILTSIALVSALTHLLDSFMSQLIWYHLILDLEILSCLPMKVIIMGCIGHGLTIFCALVRVLLLSLMSLLVTLWVQSFRSLFFLIQADCQSPTSLPPTTSLCPPVSHKVDWSKIYADHAEWYCIMVDQLLPSLYNEIVSCLGQDCSMHSGLLDFFAQSLVSCLHSCSPTSFSFVSSLSSSHPRLPGWNDSARKLRD